MSDPYKGEKKLFRLQGSWSSKRPARTHGFNAKIGFEKYAPGPEILSKMCQKSGRQTKPANFGTFWSIFRDPVHIFQNRFLRWNRELKPVILSTMNPINGTKFFLSYKGGCKYLSWKKGHQKNKNSLFRLLRLLYYTLIQLDFICQNKNLDFQKVWHTLGYNNIGFVQRL